jgi:hypothetical protein
MIRANRKVACPLLDRIEKRYSAPHWIFLREVRNDTGFQSNRSADAVAVGMYHSRGQLLIGFEKKISRSDWLRELKRPDKAEGICRFCDQWYVVIPELAIIGLDEIPITWGLMVVNGNKLQVAKQAPTLTPAPLDRGMLAAIVERAIEQAVKPYLLSKQEKNEQQWSEAFEAGKKSASSELEKFHELETRVDEFERVSGVKIDRWSASKKIGEAVKAVMDYDRTLLYARNRLSVALRELQEDTVPAIKKAIATLDREPQMVVSISAGKPASAGPTACESR